LLSLFREILDSADCKEIAFYEDGFWRPIDADGHGKDTIIESFWYEWETYGSVTSNGFLSEPIKKHAAASHPIKLYQYGMVPYLSYSYDRDSIAYS